MYRTEGVLTLLALYVGLAHSFSWDVVVAGDMQLEFYDNNGTRTHIEDIPSIITSIIYDPVHNRVLFGEINGVNFSISSFNIATRKIQFLVTSIHYVSMLRIAYDPVTQLLFWTETLTTGTPSILSNPGYANTVDQKLLVKVDEIIFYITVDSCGGYIYWTTDTKIERARFDGTEREVVINKNVRYRGGIAIDHQTQKMYWLDNLQYGRAYEMSVESADLNGENRRTLYIERDTTDSFGALLVSKDFIYWRTYTTFSQLTRNPPHNKEVKPKQFLLAQWSYAVGMASNYKIEDQTQGIQNCEPQKKLLPINSETNDCASPDVSLLCVYGKKVSGKSRCQCTQGYIGGRYDVAVCHNYCLQGDCSVSAEGQPKCRCKVGYSGERCEVNACLEYCSNNGVCSLNEESEPVCQCTGGYEGERCNVSVCQNYCFQGDCSFSAEGQLMCRCKAGYSGERCEVNACHEYCSNNGVCSLNEESEPVCQCTGGYEGERCNVSVCQNYCFQGDCSVSAEGQPKCRCNAGYSGERCEVNAYSTPTVVTGAASCSIAIDSHIIISQELNNTLKGWRIDMDHAMLNFTNDIKGTLRGWREEMEIGMSKLNNSIKSTLSDMKQEINTLRTEHEKLKESFRTVAHDVSESKSSAQFQATGQEKLKGCIDTSARHTSDQSQTLVTSFE